MDLKYKQLYFNIWIYLPIVILIGLVSFIYLVYLLTYALPLINDNYVYAQSITQISDDSPTLLLTMKKVTLSAHILLEKLSPSTMPNEVEKGWIYFGLSNFFFLMFLIGFLRTLWTNPGRVPDEWNNDQEKQINDLRLFANDQAKIKAALEMEKRMHKNIRKSQQSTKDKKEDAETVDKSTNADNAKPNEQKEAVETTVDGNVSANQQLLFEDTDPKPVDNTTTPTPEGPLVLSNYESEAERHYKERLEGEIEYIGNCIFDELLGERRFKKCNHCNKFKPERTHHCRQCNTCTIKMDHHCPWVNNCVGFYNYKFFMIMLIYAVLGLWFIWITYTEVVGDTILNSEIGTMTLFIIVLMYMLTLALAIVLTLFTLFHCYLIYNGKTTLEYCENKAAVQYSISVYDNFRDVFGHPLLWLCPIAGDLSSGGLSYLRIQKKAE